MIDFTAIEGYYYTADSKEPQVVHIGGTFDWEKLKKDRSNHVVAAFFCKYDDAGDPYKSIHIRFADGEYKCAECDIPKDAEKQTFLGVKGLPDLNFVQLWNETEVKYDGEVFNTLVPGKSVFAGFVKDKKQMS